MYYFFHFSLCLWDSCIYCVLIVHSHCRAAFHWSIQHTIHSAVDRHLSSFLCGGDGSYYEYSLNVLVHPFWWKHSYASLPVGVYLGVELLGPRVCVCSDLVDKPVLQSGCKYLYSHLMYESSSCSTSSPILPVFFILAIPVDMYWMWFNLYFLDDNEPEQLLIWLLVICIDISFFCELSVQVFCPFFYHLTLFLLVFHRSSLYNLDMGPLLKYVW